MYYWPEEPLRNSCLPANSTVPSPTGQQSNMYDPRFSQATSRKNPYLPCLRQSPSVYIVLPSIEARNGCNNIGHILQNVSASFAPGTLSTARDDGSFYSFNFADLPCPPPEVGWNSTSAPYRPVLGGGPFLSFLRGLDPEFADCIPGHSQGVDPPTLLTPDIVATEPGDPGCGIHCGPHRRAAKTPHPLPVFDPKTVGTPIPAGPVGREGLGPKEARISGELGGFRWRG